jgi:hypothetical protein
MIRDWYSSIRCRLLYHPHRLHIHHPEVTGWSWRDKDTILLCANFQILVDFVELELPQFNRFCGLDTQKHDWLYYLPFFSWYIDKKRNPRAGIEHLEWAMGLEDCTDQSFHATEQLDLYLWWTKVRPARVDPFDEVPENHLGIRDLFSEGTDLTDLQREQREAYMTAIRKAGEIEEQYEEEDTKQLIRLMKVRRGLWT